MPITVLPVNLLRFDDRGFGDIVTAVVVMVLPNTTCAVLMLRLRGRVARERDVRVRGPDRPLTRGDVGFTLGRYRR